MSDDEINSAIAAACGATNSVRHYDDSGPGSSSWMGNPNYVGDWSTRPQMVAVMDEDERLEFLNLTTGDIPTTTVEVHYVFVVRAFYTLLRMDQPTFCKAFLKAKGLWKE